MNRNTNRPNYKKLFSRKKINSEECLEFITIKNDIGYLTVHVSSIHDIVTPYSVKGYEFLDAGFKEYLERYADHIPEQLPVVLEITGCSFSAEEQEAIQNAIWHEYEFAVVTEQRSLKRHKRNAAASMLALTILTYFVYHLTMPDVMIQLLWIVLWILGDAVAELFLADIPEFRTAKRRLIQKQTMKIVFTREFVDAALPDEVISQYREAVLQNIKEEIV